MFWVWISLTVLVIVGLSVLAGKALSRPPPRGRDGEGPGMSRHQQMTGLKASGALRHRKSNRN
jgi:hypothetical protein